MCGRYFIDSPALAGGDVCPADEALALVAENGEIVTTTMRWGFDGPGGGRIINARIESAGQKPMFRALFQRQRCALPASGYYEWRGGDGQKYAVSLVEGAEFYLAGLYRFGASGREFVVLTQPPTAKIARFHNRMPVILDSELAARRWLLGVEAPAFADDARLNVVAQGPEQLQMSF